MTAIPCSGRSSPILLAIHSLTSLKPGSAGDATIIQVKQGTFDYVDVLGEHLIGDRKIASEGVVIAGRWWHPK